MPNQFYVQPANFGGIMDGVNSLAKSNRDQRFASAAGEKQAAQQAKQQKVMEEGAALLQSDDTAAIADWAFRNPEARMNFVKAVDFQDKLTDKSRLETARNVLSGQESGIDAYSKRYEQISSGGGTAEQLGKVLAEGDDQALKALALKDLSMLDPVGHKSYLESVGGTPSEQKPTARMQEFAMLDGMEDGPRKETFARMVNAEDAIKIKGIEYKKNPLTNKYEAVLDASSDVVGEQEKAIADLEADKKSRLDFATNKTKWKTGKPKYQSKIRAAKNDRKVMTNTAEQIRKTLDSYSAKYGTALKNLPGTEAQKLKGLYQTLLANSAFSTLISLKQAGGTLGAISGSELELLKAKQGEVNQSGQVDEQLRVLDQILDANQSSIQNIETEYNDTDSLYSGSFDDMNSGQTEPSTNEASEVSYVGPDLEAYNWANSNPNDPRSAAILKKLEGQ